MISVDGEWTKIEDFTVGDYSEPDEVKRYSTGSRVKIEVPEGGGYRTDFTLSIAQAIDLHATLGRYLIQSALDR